MQTTAELLTKIKLMTSRIEEASAKGFVSDHAMHLLYELESSVGDLLQAATNEFWAKNQRGAR